MTDKRALKSIIDKQRIEIQDLKNKRAKALNILATLQPTPENENQEKDLENFVDRIEEALK